jgi:hypothetical protein
MVADGRDAAEMERNGLYGTKYASSVTADTQVVTREFMPRYRLEWQEDAASWSLEPRYSPSRAADILSYRLQADEIVEFEIVAPAATLETLRLQVGREHRCDTARLQSELANKNGCVLARTILDLAAVADDAFAAVLDLRHVEFQRGEKYRVRLLWLGPPGNAISVHVLPARFRYELHHRVERLSSERVFAYRQPLAAPPSRVESCILIIPDIALDRFTTRFAFLPLVFPGVRFVALPFDEANRQLSRLRTAEVVIFVNMFHDRSATGLAYDELCFDLHRHGVCTIFCDSEAAGLSSILDFSLSEGARSHLNGRRLYAQRCHFIVDATENPTLVSSRTELRPRCLQDSTSSVFGPELLGKLAAAIRCDRAPRVAIVVPLGQAVNDIEIFLDRIIQQSYPGDIAIVLVHDASTPAHANLAHIYGHRLSVRAIENRQLIVAADAESRGEYSAHQVGLEAANAEIYLFIDYDCLINRDFVAAHVFEHWWEDVDLVVAGHSTEIDDGDPSATIDELEKNPKRPERLDATEAMVESPFLKCRTHPFSVKRRWIANGPLFDIDLSQSVKGASAFGWAAIEMGYRLYAEAAVVRVAEKAFAVRRADFRSGAAGMEGGTDVFPKLCQKHPDFALVARHWLANTAHRLGVNGAISSTPAGRASDPMPSRQRPQRRLRILTYRWHAAHQYELYKLPHDFVLVTGIGPRMISEWSFEQRPLRANAQLVPVQQIDPRDFDLAILHFDENVYIPHLCNGAVPPDWGDAFEWLLHLDNLPKAGICHGTVPFVGQFGADPSQQTSFVVHEDDRRFLVERLAAARVRVVCNSYQAQMEWGFADSRVIWQGFDPLEFPPGTLERDVLTLKDDFQRPHYRGTWEREQVLARLRPGIGVEAAGHPGAPIENRRQNPFAIRQFRAYVDRIRQFKIYLNTTLRSPMPRSRGEAMMTGVIPVSLSNHDVHRFIENGIDGFYAAAPDELADFINDLLRDDARVRVMSRAARLKALDVFNHDRYLDQWEELLREMC